MRELTKAMDLWRISVHQNLNGEGGIYSDGRWNTIGQPVVYLAESSAGALLEILVHLPIERDEIPDQYTLLRVTMPAGLAISNLVPESQGWETQKILTRAIGDTWLASAETALARVPSAIVPECWNYLLNPLHPDARKMQIANASTRLYDMRLLRIRG
ncbi:RES domain-containing protein [Granulicella pectinivorans]|uniref:RES domain-containing protein n=1 Tax=Granulicella pectinivorans TaxID=474950 RepID=A0A1I6MJR5_9BACT|nr:RES family NAD+ phosphorylase [Granulicella pectinivorans]SFS15868.1 RES domain-containing protein [Granulicella pectinivorans]